MIILGIDPGTATTGWGLIKVDKPNKLVGLELIDFGCIITSSDSEMGDRLVILKKGLDKVIKTHKPACVVIERLFFGSNVTSAITVGQARGVVLLASSEQKLDIFEYTGLQVKLTVAEHGRAEKSAIQEAVRKYLGVKELPNPKDQDGKEVFRFRDDAYDAVAAAICHVLKASAPKEKKTKPGKKKAK